MVTYNTRLGFATNSSSTHSIILSPSRVQDQQLDHEWQFGWDNFVAASKEAKLHYLAGQVSAHLWGIEPGLTKHLLASLVYGGTGIQPPAALPEIDHQSYWALPQMYQRGWRQAQVTLNLDFVRDLRDWLLDDAVKVLGGNDNQGEDYNTAHRPADAREAGLGLGDGGGAPGLNSDWIARRAQDRIWVLFDRLSGTRVTLDLTPGNYATRQEPRPAVPNLVDMKITDWCDKGCRFCYQGSTASGAHADSDEILRLSYALSQLEVFELVLGGGEPTKHPSFVKLLEDAKQEGLAVSFTTKDLSWIRDSAKFRSVLHAASCWAYSVGSAGDIAEYAEILREALKAPEILDLVRKQKLPYSKSYITSAFPVHIVMGTVSRAEFKAMIDEILEAHLGVTLLGYKRDGRGAHTDHQPYEWLQQELEELHRSHRGITLGVDTPLLQELGTAGLEAIGVDPKAYRLREGFDACYIDACSMTVHTSSYGEGRKCSRPLRRPGQAGPGSSEYKQIILDHYRGC